MIVVCNLCKKMNTNLKLGSLCEEAHIKTPWNLYGYQFFQLNCSLSSFLRNSIGVHNHSLKFFILN